MIIDMGLSENWEPYPEKGWFITNDSHWTPCVKNPKYEILTIHHYTHITHHFVYSKQLV